MILNGSFDLDAGFIGWERNNVTNIVKMSEITRDEVNISEGLFYENAAKIGSGISNESSSIRYHLPVIPGHTYLITFKAIKYLTLNSNGIFKLSKVIRDRKGVPTYIDFGEADAPPKPLLYKYISKDAEPITKSSIDEHNTTRYFSYFIAPSDLTEISISFEAPKESEIILDGVMAFDLTETFGATPTSTTAFNDVVTMVDGFLGGYWEGGFSIPKKITIGGKEEIRGAIKVRATIRGFCSKKGRLSINFTEGNYGTPLFNKYWFTAPIYESEGINRVNDIFNAPDTQIFTYKKAPSPFKADPPLYINQATGEINTAEYEAGWPRYINDFTQQDIPILVSDTVETFITEDYIGEKLVMDFYTYPARFTYLHEGRTYYRWSPVTINISPDKGLEGFGSLMVSTDYSIYIKFDTLTKHSVSSSIDSTQTHVMALRFMVDSWIIGNDYGSQKEDIGKEPRYFVIPVETGDSLAVIRDKIQNGGVTSLGMEFDSLETQINDYFNTVAEAINSTERDTFRVLADIETGLSPEYGYTMADIKNRELFGDMLRVRISTTNEEIQHEISCYSYLCNDFIIRTICNQYFINENLYELRSFYDMYGIDRPQGTVSSAEYKPLAYGFKFNLDIITEYTETESSSIDVTPIPGQSSAKAIGIDVVGATRDLTISGIRVDNSNIWTFHVPWQEEGENRGIIYTGTSNWGWVKFMKAIVGTFQMMSGPYRLIMMTVPSSSQMQYYPTRDGCYQYSDGTYVVLAGWEDMCYVMIESFMYSRHEDMFNAIQYTLKLKRVAPLLS